MALVARALTTHWPKPPRLFPLSLSVCDTKVYYMHKASYGATILKSVWTFLLRFFLFVVHDCLFVHLAFDRSRHLFLVYS